MTNLTKSPDSTIRTGRDKLIVGFLAAWGASYIMTQLSLSGVNFELMGVDSEIVKSTIIAQLVTLFISITPRNVVEYVRDSIIFVRRSWKEWKDAATSNNIGE